MKCALLILALTQISGPALAGNGNAPQSPVATLEAPLAKQDERLDPRKGWTKISDFPHVELVEEGTGRPRTELTNLVLDSKLKESIDRREFKSLMVRNLSVRLNEAVTVGNTIVMPYGASIKQSKWSQSWWWSRDHSTINLAGLLSITVEGDNVRVDVQHWANSSNWEDLLQYLGWNDYVNLEFARAIAPPIIQHWFNEDPARKQALLKLLPAKIPPKP